MMSSQFVPCLPETDFDEVDAMNYMFSQVKEHEFLQYQRSTNDAFFDDHGSHADDRFSQRSIVPAVPELHGTLPAAAFKKPTMSVTGRASFGGGFDASHSFGESVFSSVLDEDFPPTKRSLSGHSALTDDIQQKYGQEDWDGASSVMPRLSGMNKGINSVPCFGLSTQNQQSVKTPSVPRFRESSPNLTQPAVQLQTPSDASIPVKVVAGMGSPDNIRSVREIPEKYRCLFPFPYFNVVQSKVFDQVMYADNPLVVCSPTGSGKTVLFELAIVRLLMKLGNGSSMPYKIVYMAPIKALCSERFLDWKSKFEEFGLRCTELTGDTDMDDFHTLQMCNIVLTTPEKWDSMTRKWKDHTSLVQMVRLFLIDEVHLLSDDARGATIEAVVSRMKTVQVAINKEAEMSQTPSMRFIAVSATIPNVQDISRWLETGILPAIGISLGEEYRPVSLRKVVLGYPCSASQSDFKFDLSLNYKLSGIIQTYSENKPTIVFCSTRKSATQAASVLVKDARFIMDGHHKNKLTRFANTMRDAKLRDLVMQGVGFHHAGMDVSDRKNIEAMFGRGDLPVLFCTSTLSMGVNLPAHLVVIKGTTHYVMGGYEEYCESQILQMIGRAGRPQFDVSATAVILTNQKNKSKYQALVSGCQEIESSLHHHLTEHVNAEIVLGTISSVPMAQDWLRSTFLYIRLQENPKRYGAPEGLDKEALGRKLQGLCLRAVKSLQSLELIQLQENSSLSATDAGCLMARYCIAFDTMQSFFKIVGTESLEELIILLSKAKEFEDINIRQSERKILNTLNKDKNRQTIRYPIGSKIKTTEQKINCLIQAALGCLPVIEFALTQDTAKILRTAQRVSRFLMEYLLMKGKFKAALNAVILCKCIQSKLWENSKFVSRQLDKIGAAMSSALVNAGITTFEKLEEVNPRELELIVNRHPPFGSQIKEIVAALPKLDVIIDQDANHQASSADLVVKVKMLNFETRKKYLANRKGGFPHSCMLLVGDAANNIIFRQRVLDTHLLESGVWSRRLTVHQAAKSAALSVNLISLEYSGLDVQSSFVPQYAREVASLYSLNLEHSRRNASEEESCSELASSKVVVGRSCGHKCSNKMWCGHDCCKYGTRSAREEGKAKKRMRSDFVASESPPSVPKRKGTNGNRYYDHIQERNSVLPKAAGSVQRMKLNSSLGGNRLSHQDSERLALAYSYQPRKLDFEKTKATDSLDLGEVNVDLNMLGCDRTLLSQVSSFQSLRKNALPGRDSYDASLHTRMLTGAEDFEVKEDMEDFVDMIDTWAEDDLSPREFPLLGTEFDSQRLNQELGLDSLPESHSCTRGSSLCATYVDDAIVHSSSIGDNDFMGAPDGHVLASSVASSAMVYRVPSEERAALDQRCLKTRASRNRDHYSSQAACLQPAARAGQTLGPSSTSLSKAGAPFETSLPGLRCKNSLPRSSEFKYDDPALRDSFVFPSKDSSLRYNCNVPPDIASLMDAHQKAVMHVRQQATLESSAPSASKAGEHMAALSHMAFVERSNTRFHGRPPGETAGRNTVECQDRTFYSEGEARREWLGPEPLQSGHPKATSAPWATSYALPVFNGKVTQRNFSMLGDFFEEVEEDLVNVKVPEPPSDVAHSFSPTLAGKDRRIISDKARENSCTPVSDWFTSDISGSEANFRDEDFDFVIG